MRPRARNQAVAQGISARTIFFDFFPSENRSCVAYTMRPGDVGEIGFVRRTGRRRQVDAGENRVDVLNFRSKLNLNHDFSRGLWFSSAAGTAA